MPSQASTATVSTLYVRDVLRVFLTPLLLSLLAVAAVVAVVLWAFYDARLAARRDAEQQAGNLALAMDSEISRLFDGLDEMLQVTVASLETPGFDALDPVIRHEILFNPVRVAAAGSGIVVADETGKMIYSWAGPTRARMDLSGRRIFDAHRDRADAGVVFGPPQKALTDGHWVIGLSRRIDHPDGSFGGIAAARVELRYFERLFENYDIGRKGMISLWSTEGALIARGPGYAHDVNRAIYDPRTADLLKRSPLGTFDHVSRLDGIPRLFSFRKLNGYPFIVMVGLSYDEIYAEWNRRLLFVGAALVLFVAFASLLLWNSARGILAHRRLELAAAVAEREKASALERLEIVFQHSLDIMVIVGVRDGNEFVYEAVNPVWENTTGVTANKAIGRTARECLPPGLSDVVLAGWRTCRETRQVQSFVFSSQDGRIWETKVVPVLGRAGTVERLIAAGRDVSDRKKLENTLLRLNVELEQRVERAVADREAALRGASTAERMQALGQLAGGIAHDFNNVLQGFSACASLIERRSDNPAACERLARKAMEVADRGASITRRLLAFSRRDELRTETIDVGELAFGMSELLVHALGSGIEMRTEVDRAAPRVFADKGQLETVLLNLATNGRDAMPAGGRLTLSAAAMAVSDGNGLGLPAGRYVRISVADTGFGMDGATLERVTEPFFTTKAVGKGTGLGLSMAKGFAEQSGGALEIVSAPNRGTTVSVWLPEAEGAAAPERAVAAPGRVLAERRLRVLLVDDDMFVRETLAEELATAYSVACASGGGEAVAMLDAGAGVDVLVTDFTMPGMDGLSLIHEARARRPTLPAVLLTGYAGDFAGMAESGAGGGSFLVLRKPIGVAELTERIDAFAALAGLEMASEG